MKAYYQSIFYVIIVIAVCVSLMPIAGFGQDQTELFGTDACSKCHANQRKLYDTHAHSKLKEGGVETGIGIGCETCHGPGKAHSDMDLADLQKLKKEKGDMKIRGAADNKGSEMCIHCHSKEGKDNIQLASDYLIVPLQQYTELSKSKKIAAMKMPCTYCHDQHGTSKEQKFMKRTCLKCHTGKTYGKPVQIKAMSKLSCESCHMPYAVTGALDEKIQDYQKGTGRSHIFGISVDEDYTLNDGTNQASLTEVTVTVNKKETKHALARLTVEMTCYACHKTGEAHDMDRDEMIKMAKKVH
ncbi:multiheme c-type cytochrome [Candidatus Latescibacterota bacterium]